MHKNTKRFLALCLSFLMVLGLFTACKTGDPGTTTAPATDPAPSTTPAETQSPEEAKVLKVLTLGHSLAVDSGHMLNMIWAVEGIGEYEEVLIGTLYYSGCPINKHLEFITTNAPEYRLYLSSTNTPNDPPTILENVTMKDALKREYWDIVIMQGGVFEIAEDLIFTAGGIQAIQNYANKHNLNPNATFAWHMPWATPVTDSLRDTYPNAPNTYYSNYEVYNHQRSGFYEGITQRVGQYIVTDETFQILIPSGTAIENALSSYLEETDLHRDYAHASDLGRVIASYTWYCSLMGIEKLDYIKLATIPKAFLKSIKDKSQDYVLTEAEKNIILESVNNALKEPLKMTQSQYTTAPAN